MRTAIAGFLAVFLVTGAISLLIAWQEHRAFYADPDIRAVLEATPNARAHLRESERDAAREAARRLLTHVLLLGCLVLAGIALSQRARHRELLAKAERWKALYESASGARRRLQAELGEKGPQVVRHGRDKTFSAICARCGCVLAQRFKTRDEALSDRARTETEGCLACPSEAQLHNDVTGSHSA